MPQSFLGTRKKGDNLQAYPVDFGWNAGDKVILEYTKNEG